MGTTNLRAYQGDRSQTGQRNVFTLEAVVDFSKNNVGISEVCQIFDVFPGWRVMAASQEVLVAEDGVALGDLGDDTDPNGYVAIQDLEVVAFVHGAGAYAAAGRAYTVADTVDFIPSAAVDTCKIAFKILVADLNVATPPIDVT